MNSSLLRSVDDSGGDAACLYESDLIGYAYYENRSSEVDKDPFVENYQRQQRYWEHVLSVDSESHREDGMYYENVSVPLSSSPSTARIVEGFDASSTLQDARAEKESESFTDRSEHQSSAFDLLYSSVEEMERGKERFQSQDFRSIVDEIESWIHEAETKFSEVSKEMRERVIDKLGEIPVDELCTIPRDFRNTLVTLYFTCACNLANLLDALDTIKKIASQEDIDSMEKSISMVSGQFHSAKECYMNIRELQCVAQTRALDSIKQERFEFSEDMRAACLDHSSRRYEKCTNVDAFVEFAEKLCDIEEADENLEIEDVDWNSLYQQALDMPMETEPEQIERAAFLQSILDRFCISAKKAARTIIEEISMPSVQKSIRPAMVGGIAGGTKFIHRQIFYKLVTDVNNLYGGTTNAMKAASHEKMGLELYLSTNTPRLRAPLMISIDYKGYRILAASLLPLSPHSLRYGSSDGGKTVHKAEEADILMREAAAKLHIAEHPVRNGEMTLAAPCDVEVHEGIDGRYYVLDTARLMPPAPLVGSPFVILFVEASTHALRILTDDRIEESGINGNILGNLLGTNDIMLEKVSNATAICYSRNPDNPICNMSVSAFVGKEIFGDCLVLEWQKGLHLFQLLRPELVRQSDTPLSSDAFTRFGSCDSDLYNSEVRNFFERKLMGEIIPALAREIDAGTLLLVSSSQITSIFHSRGINMRYLPNVRNSLSPENYFAKSALMTEMLARVCKQLLRERLRSVRVDSNSSAARRITVSFFNTIFGRSPSSNEFWRGTLRIRLLLKYGRHSSIFNSIDCINGYDFDPRAAVQEVALFLTLQYQTGVVFSRSKNQQILRNENVLAVNKPFSDEDFSCILPTENRPSAHISSSFRVDEFAKKMFSPGGSLSERLSQIKYIFGDRYFSIIPKIQVTLKRVSEILRFVPGSLVAVEVCFDDVLIARKLLELIRFCLLGGLLGGGMLGANIQIALEYYSGVLLEYLEDFKSAIKHYSEALHICQAAYGHGSHSYYFSSERSSYEGSNASNVDVMKAADVKSSVSIRGHPTLLVILNRLAMAWEKLGSMHRMSDHVVLFRQLTFLRIIPPKYIPSEYLERYFITCDEDGEMTLFRLMQSIGDCESPYHLNKWKESLEMNRVKTITAWLDSIRQTLDLDFLCETLEGTKFLRADDDVTSLFETFSVQEPDHPVGEVSDTYTGINSHLCYKSSNLDRPVIKHPWANFPAGTYIDVGIRNQMNSSTGSISNFVQTRDELVSVDEDTFLVRNFIITSASRVKSETKIPIELPLRDDPSSVFVGIGARTVDEISYRTKRFRRERDAEWNILQENTLKFGESVSLQSYEVFTEAEFIDGIDVPIYFKSIRITPDSLGHQIRSEYTEEITKLVDRIRIDALDREFTCYRSQFRTVGGSWRDYLS